MSPSWTREPRWDRRPGPDRRGRRPTKVVLLALALGTTMLGCDSGRCDPHPARPVARQEPGRSPPAAREAVVLRSPLDAKDTSEAKQRFVDLLRRSLNDQIKDPARQWDFWSEGSSRYPLPGQESAYLMSFRRQTASGQEGFLVIGTIAGQNTVVHGYWKAPAGIDDIHVMDMGPAGKMIYTVSFDTTHSLRRIYHHLLRHDGQRIQPVWSYSLSYEVSQPKTYKPVSISFRDVDRDGVPEVRVRAPGAETPRLWKRRWAQFKWDAPANEFLPLRGLAFTKVGTHRPHWAAFGLLEAIRAGSLEDARRFGSDMQSCRPIEEIWETFARRQYRPVGPLRLVDGPAKGPRRTSRVVVDLERLKDPSRYQAEIHLRRAVPNDAGWRVCQVRFFRL